LTKRRLFARSPIGLLEQSTFGGRRGSRTAISIRRENRAAVSVAVFSRFAIYANVVGRTGGVASCSTASRIPLCRKLRRKDSHWFRRGTAFL